MEYRELSLVQGYIYIRGCITPLTAVILSQTSSENFTECLYVTKI